MINSLHQNTRLLRFTTAGSVDDGKSTLIGRLLYDSKAVFDDQYEAIRHTSDQRGEEYVNLALLTDGLRAEREQGITIDVAYRYFSTPKRKFIIADVPGHAQYTRNMVTGASTAHLAVILIDARKGVTTQTRRHAVIASLLGIPHIVVCVNKMDIVGYSEGVFNAVRNEFEAFASKLDLAEVHFIPVSALNGENVVECAANMDWYKGETLLRLLENVDIAYDPAKDNARFPVQYVIRPQSAAYHDYRGYAGRIAGGVLRKGDEVSVLPSGLVSKIRSIDTFEGPLEEACAPMSVTLALDDEIDISRGDMIVKRNDLPKVTHDLDLMICWLSTKELNPSGKYIIRHTSRETRCIIKNIQYKLNIDSLEPGGDDKRICMNDIARITLRTAQPLFVDKYSHSRSTGSIILIDEGTNETVCAGMIL